MCQDLEGFLTIIWFIKKDQISPLVISPPQCAGKTVVHNQYWFKRTVTYLDVAKELYDVLVLFIIGLKTTLVEEADLL